MNVKRLLGLAVLAIVAPLSGANGHVALDFPVGGEIFDAGETVNIDWHIAIDHGAANWDLFFSSDGGQTWEIIAMDLPKSQQDYLWEVPDIDTEQGRVKIYMDNNSGQDYQDISGDFTVLPLPIEDIPTLTEWGMLIMGLLLMVFATIAVLRKKGIALKRTV